MRCDSKIVPNLSAQRSRLNHFIKPFERMLAGHVPTRVIETLIGGPRRPRRRLAKARHRFDPELDRPDEINHFLQRPRFHGDQLWRCERQKK
jgi:hypothetical protein